MKRLLILVAVLAGALGAKAVLALDVRIKGVSVSDAETGSTKLMVGRKVRIVCQYEYDAYSASVPAWQVLLQSDGQTLGTYAAKSPPLSVPSMGSQGWNMATPPLWVEGFVTPTTVGQHQAKCTLDPDGKLKGVDANPANNAYSTTFVADVAPVTVIPKTPGPSAATPPSPIVPPSKGGFTTGAGVAAAPGQAPALADPALKLSLKAQVLSNCGLGQDVVAITGTLSNIGQGFALLPPGKQIVKIDAAAGVFGAAAGVSGGNLAPGQSVPVSVNLKAKAMPVSLAGASLKLDASVAGGISQSSYGGNQQTLTVAFPANFCKTPTATGGVLRQAPPPAGRSPAK